MKITRLTLFFITAIFLFSACKKKKVDPDNPNGVSGELVRLLEEPAREAHGVLSASLDGKYFGTELKEKYYFTKDGGQNWQTVSGTGFQSRYFKSDINKNGYKVWKEEMSYGKTSLINLETGNTTPIQFFQNQIPAYNSNGFFLGNDDYVYVIKAPKYYYQKIGSSTWDTLNIDVSSSYNNGRYMAYLGMNAQTGGAAFVDDANQKVLIHHPNNNTIDIKAITYDLERIYKRLSGGDPATRYAYNGSDKIVAGNNQGIAIIDIPSGQVTYYEWPSEYKGYDAPLTLGIDTDGTVFASVNFFTEYDSKATQRLKISNGKLSLVFATSNIISRGKYSYFFTPTDLRRLSTNKEEAFYTPHVADPRSGKVDFVSARLFNAKKYVLLNFTNKDISYTGLFVYDEEKKQFEYIPESFGRYDYIYSEGNSIYVFGERNVFYSKDNGQNWQKQARNHRPRIFRYITKGDNKYYATAIMQRSQGGASEPFDNRALVVMSSPDLFQWTNIGGINESDLKEVLRVITPSGFGVSHVFSNGMYFDQETRDFGENWKLEPPNFKYFNAEHKGFVYHIYGTPGIENMTIKKMSEDYELIEERKIPANGYKLWIPDQVYFNESDDIFLIGYEGFYTIKK